MDGDAAKPETWYFLDAPDSDPFPPTFRSPTVATATAGRPGRGCPRELRHGWRNAAGDWDAPGNSLLAHEALMDDHFGLFWIHIGFASIVGALMVLFIR